MVINYIQWLPCFRIIPSCFPPIELFERVSNPEDFNAIYEIEQLTNPRLRNEIGEIQLVPKNEQIFGAGTSQIMAAFTHLNPIGSRFSDGTYGVYYAANKLETAILETKYHTEKFFSEFKSPKVETDMRVLLADLKANLHDICGLKDQLPEIYDPNNYAASQALGKKIRADGSSAWGIHYDSVRDTNGKCVAIFRPKALQNCRQERHLSYVWDGEKISHVYRKEELLC